MKDKALVTVSSTTVVVVSLFSIFCFLVLPPKFQIQIENENFIFDFEISRASLRGGKSFSPSCWCCCSKRFLDVALFLSKY